MRKITAILYISFVTSFLGGCAMLSNGSNMQEKGFYGRMTPAKNSAPLPVEIAKDIEFLSEEGTLYITEDEIVARIEEAVRSNKAVAPRRIASRGFKKRKKEPAFLSKNRRGPLLGSRGGRKRFSSKGSKGPLAIGESKLPKLEGGKTVSYIVRLGDTLMKIAFEKYANYLRWKDIYHVNKDKMKSPRKMKVGTELTIQNVKYVYIKRDGKPYLIRKEDTLKSISQKLYGTPDRWKDIWKNNPQLIKNPKKIYAGFTLHYQPSGKKTDMLRVPAGKNNKTVKK